MTSGKRRAALLDRPWQRRLRAWRRAEFMALADAQSMRGLGDPPREDLERKIRRYPADA